MAHMTRQLSGSNAESPASTAKRLSRQVSAFTSLLYDTLSTATHNAASWLLGMKPRAEVVPSQSAVFVSGSGCGLARELALRFAAAGYTVFVQASPDQVGALVARWADLKSRLNAQAAEGGSQHPGALIPLGFSSRDGPARLDALKTVTAFCREHDLQLAALVNCVDATGSPRFRSSSSSSSSVTSDGPGSDIAPIKAALRQRRGRSSSLSAADLGFGETPLPLAISTEEHLHDLMGEIISSIGFTQDLLPALRKSRGRVLNVWCRAQSVGFALFATGPLAMAEDAFRAASRSLAIELRPFGVSTSIILPGATSLVVSKHAEPPTLSSISVSTDGRSILTPASDPAIRAAFSTQVKVAQAAAWKSSFWRIDDALVFRVVRSACEARYPRAVYPIGLDQLALEMAQLLPTNLVSLWEQWAAARERRRFA